MTRQELRELLENGIVLLDALDENYTKANSKRLRAVLNTIQKNAVQLKKNLIASDNAQ
jgi:type II secretory pathway component PulF